MISRIDHISIAVKDYEKALSFFRDPLKIMVGNTAGRYFPSVISHDLSFCALQVKAVSWIISLKRENAAGFIILLCRLLT